MTGNISRRLAVGVIGGGVLVAPVVARARGGEASVAGPSPFTGVGRDAATLLHPLTPGARLGRWVIVSIEPLHHGAITVMVRPDDSTEHVFRLELLARDSAPLAARPPAETRNFAVFVCNGGDGWLPTEEEQGLAAMTLGAIVERNERQGDAGGFLTHAQRVATNVANLLPE